MKQLKFLAVQLVALAMLNGLTGNSPAVRANDSAYAIESGTLNLLLANKNGFVILTDSRRTQPSTGQYWDDSQKLFRVGPRSAIAIAGFASWASQGSPLDFQVAALLRQEFDDPKWKSGKRPITDLPPFVNTAIGYELELVAALQATNQAPVSADKLNFQVIAAGFNNHGKPEIIKITFAPTVQTLGPFNLPAPRYDIQTTSIPVEGFTFCTAGIDTVARKILNGNFPTEDQRILKFYSSRQNGQTNQLSLTDLSSLAAAVSQQTKLATALVGGGDEVCLIPRKGRVRWTFPPLPNSRQKVASEMYNVGLTYTPDGLTPNEYAESHGKHAMTGMLISLYQPFDRPLGQIFMASRFRDVSVSIDGNAFAGNHFDGVTFKYQGGAFSFFNNSLGDCILEVPPNVQIPHEFNTCRVQRLPSLILERTLGAPLRPEPQGCVKRGRGGRLIIKTSGKENGKSCKGSGVRVTFAPLGFTRP